MAHRVRRHSMELLQLYDLDQSTINLSLLPSLPPPRKNQSRGSSNSNSDRYQFLCDITRTKTDPVYAATAMFKTLPKSLHVKHHRQLLGSYIPPRIITPLKFTSLKSSEPKTPNIDNDAEEEEEQDEEEESSDEDEFADDDDDSGGEDQSGGSSSSSSSDDNNDILNDDNDKGVVQQIFDRNKKN